MNEKRHSEVLGFVQDTSVQIELSEVFFSFFHTSTYTQVYPVYTLYQCIISSTVSEESAKLNISSEQVNHPLCECETVKDKAECVV